jgi:uncharacterized protein DUF1566
MTTRSSSKTLRMLTMVAAVLTMAAGSTYAQTTAAGPYYAWPAWDQKLPGTTRFVVLSNWNSDAVLDRETGLVWERAPQTTPVDSDGATARCLELALGDRQGWRLPTIQELLSLKDPTVPFAVLALPNGHPFIIPGGLPNYLFWSATTSALSFAISPPSVYTANMLGGGSGVGIFSKQSSTFKVWCVRGGQGVNPQ